MTTSIYDFGCPKCEKEVWVSNGDPNDITYPDIEALKCCHCGHCWWVDEFADDGVNSPEDIAEDTHKTPNEAAGI
tara:strand:- start:1265 stop:1489 length:225 start_codon:yes stop_codon:yes gene_type:complete